MKSGIELIAAERQRQIEELGWTAEDDDGHTDESLAMAACHYALPDSVESPVITLWPESWDFRWDQKDQDDRITALTKAGALIAAEIDRLQRLQGGEV